MSNNYEEMSDDEINYLVAIKEGRLNPRKSFEECMTDREFFLHESFDDYCNYIDAAWPIMVKYRIEVIHPRNGSEVGSAYYFGDSNIRVLAHDDKNVIRAAMIVRLMIGDSDEKN